MLVLILYLISCHIVPLYHITRGGSSMKMFEMGVSMDAKLKLVVKILPLREISDLLECCHTPGQCVLPWV